MTLQRHCGVCGVPIEARDLRTIYCYPCLVAQGRSTDAVDIAENEERRRFAARLARAVVTGEDGRPGR